MISQVMQYFLYYSFVSCIQVSSQTSEPNLHKSLFDDYTPETRPVNDSKYPVYVTLDVEFVQLMSVNERTQQVTSKLLLHQSWTNTQLMWDPKEWDDVNQLHVRANAVWNPDIVLYNNADERFNGASEKYRSLIEIKSNGTHYWFSSAVYTSTCSFDATYFPFDVQTCSLEFRSWVYDVTKIELRTNNGSLLTERYVNSSEWEVVRVKKETNLVEYSCCVNQFAVVKYSFTFQRHLLYYGIHVIFPATILVSLMFLSFLLPIGSNERVSLTATLMLAFFFFHEFITATLPKSADSTPILCMLLMILIVECAISLAASCVVMLLYHKRGERDARSLPSRIRKHFLNFNRKEIRNKNSVLINHYSHDSLERDIKNKFHEESMKRKTSHEYNHNENDYRRKSHENNYFDVYDNHQLHSDLIELMKKKRSLSSTKEDDFSVLGNILHELYKMNDTMLEDKRRHIIDNEWKTLVTRIDRVLFVLFLVILIVSVIGLWLLYLPEN